MADTTRFQRVAGAMNRAVVPLLHVPVLDGLLGKVFTEVSYTGRKSGKHVHFPANYKRSGDTVTIGVAMADRKSWWRNFTGDGAPVSVTLDGATRTGHGQSVRADDGSVRVRITLDPDTAH